MPRKLKHGHASKSGRTPEYGAWSDMKARCLLPSHRFFKWYGARGIGVCDSWVASFETFLADMGPRPPGHSLDRKDNDGPYCKENCRWATRAIQDNNKSTTRRLEYHGETLSLTQWEKRFNLTKGVLHHRLNKGWSIERALTEPTQVSRKKDTCQRGHPLTPENIQLIHTAERTVRLCRRCSLDRSKKYRNR